MARQESLEWLKDEVRRDKDARRKKKMDEDIEWIESIHEEIERRKQERRQERYEIAEKERDRCCFWYFVWLVLTIGIALLLFVSGPYAWRTTMFGVAAWLSVVLILSIVTEVCVCLKCQF